jgi:hypothetical protein
MDRMPGFGPVDRGSNPRGLIVKKEMKNDEKN